MMKTQHPVRLTSVTVLLLVCAGCSDDSDLSTEPGDTNDSSTPAELIEPNNPVVESDIASGMSQSENAPGELGPTTVRQEAQVLLDRPWELRRYTDSEDGALRDVLPMSVFQFLLESNSSFADSFDQCVSQSGSYELGDGFVVIRLDGDVDAIDCEPNGPAYQQQGRTVGTILNGQPVGEPGELGTPLMYAVDEDRLELSTPDGRQLIFVEVGELQQQ